MLDDTVDLAGYDLVWRNKPNLPVANEENKKIEETLKQRKIEVERLKVILENNINKGKNIKEHFNDLCQTLNYKQQLYKSKQHELEMEVHAEKILEREYSRLEQEIKAANQDIKSLKARQKQRETAIAEQTEKKEQLKNIIQWDEDALMQHLEKSAQVEKDNMALLKYTIEDDSKLNELEMNIEKLNKETYEQKNALEEVNTEVLIVQTEMDHIQDEFQNAYVERNNLISNWEKVIHQIQQRNKEVNKLSEYIMKLREEEVALRRSIKEQTDLLSVEMSRNRDLERKIEEKDRIATDLRNHIKYASENEKDLKAQLSTVRNVLNNVLYLKQVAENNFKQCEKQLSLKKERLQVVEKSNKSIEDKIEKLSKETFEADHYTRELDAILHSENDKNFKIQKEVDILIKDIMTYDHEINELKTKEKIVETHNKDCQAEIRNLNARIYTIDQLRLKQESEMYEIESKLEKLRRRVKKMSGVTNEEERRKLEKERSSLLIALEEKKGSLNMLTEELKLMRDKIAVSKNHLEANKKLNAELSEKIKFLDFYIANSNKTVKCCISRKQELLVQECLERFQMKKFQKLLNKKNKSVASIQKSKLEFEMMMKERIEELKRCNELLEAEMRTEVDECGIVKKKLLESNDKIMKLQAKYKIILDALGISESGENAEAEFLIKAENEKRDLEFDRDKLMSDVLKNEEELSALKNTVWLINAANEQFRQVLHPPGINPEDAELMKSTETESQTLAIEMHRKQNEMKTLEQDVKGKDGQVKEGQNFYGELQDALRDRETETELLSGELSALSTKIKRATKNTSRLSLELRNKSPYPGIEEDIRIHLLREITRTVSDLLFSSVDSMPEVYSKIQELYVQADLPLPSRTLSSLSFRSGSSLSNFSKLSTSETGSSRTFSPSVVNLGSL
ncbi:coiled-coil domain-containing protein 39 [Trichonephila inaurata madagascariensis]|uniref:Coiled-coil domain-containing protein 39 n=1 Tax=Trichonephila inaurata madagascariensis TaxID=2747483 RepID=A0A8X6JNA6_9ARAC|nr:coiled-coil domain-containing protein 39 [Trichonephila inaurata madagascariensis]